MAAPRQRSQILDLPACLLLGLIFATGIIGMASILRFLP